MKCTYLDSVFVRPFSFVQDQPPFYFVSHVPCLNTLINFHVVLKYGFVGTCPGIEPVTGRSLVQFQDKYPRSQFFPSFFLFSPLLLLFNYFFLSDLIRLSIDLFIPPLSLVLVQWFDLLATIEQILKKKH